MSHPFEALPAGRRPRVFLPLLAATLVVWAAAAVIDRPLETPAAPLGIRPLLDDDRPGVWAAGVLRARRWPLAAVGVPLGVGTVARRRARRHGERRADHPPAAAR